MRADLQLEEALCEFSAVRLTPDSRRNGKAVLPFCLLIKRCKDLAACLRCKMVSGLERGTALRNRYNVNTEKVVGGAKAPGLGFGLG